MLKAVLVSIPRDPEFQLRRANFGAAANVTAMKGFQRFIGAKKSGSPLGLIPELPPGSDEMRDEEDCKVRERSQHAYPVAPIREDQGGD